MTTGKLINSKLALEYNIVDKIAIKDMNMNELMEDIIKFIKEFNILEIPLDQKRISLMPIKNLDTAKDEIIKYHNIIKKNYKNLLAPLKIVDSVDAAISYGTGLNSFKKGLNKESENFEELANSSQARALQHFFFAERKVNTAPKTTEPIITIKNAGIIGGGTMGSGIAISFLNAGYPVTLIEMSENAVLDAFKRIENTYKSSSLYKTGKMTEDQLIKIMSQLEISTDMNKLHNKDIIIEAVFESSEIKKNIFKQLDKICKKDAILATNTSGLDIDEIAAVTSRTHNVIGTRKLF